MKKDYSEIFFYYLVGLTLTLFAGYLFGFRDGSTPSLAFFLEISCVSVGLFRVLYYERVIAGFKVPVIHRRTLYHGAGLAVNLSVLFYIISL